MNDSEKKPWEMEKSLVNVINSYDATIIGEEKDGKYPIEFYDTDGGIVEALLEKEKFEGLPHSIAKGTEFFVVIYSIKGRTGLTISTWPIAKYWHESWKK